MKKFYTHKIRINKGQKNMRLDQALTKLLDKYTRSQIKILIKNKNIKKNNIAIIEPSYKVKEGDEFLISIPKINQTNFEPADIPLDIVYEDNDILVINKNAGIVVHPAPGNQNYTLVNALIHHTQSKLSYINEKNRPGIVHRLDKDTSGLMVVAKNNSAHENLSKQFKDHSITRKYKAVIWGTLNNQKISGYISRHKINRKKMILNKDENGKFSVTYVKNINSFDIYSIVECKLETGRTHQVRVHLDSINSPIVGDKLYGKNKINKFSKNAETFNKFLILKNFERQALHAFHLSFIHPVTKKSMEFLSEFPLDIKNLLDFLLKY